MGLRQGESGEAVTSLTRDSAGHQQTGSSNTIRQNNNKPTHKSLHPPPALQQSTGSSSITPSAVIKKQSSVARMSTPTRNASAGKAPDLSTEAGRNEFTNCILQFAGQLQAHKGFVELDTMRRVEVIMILYDLKTLWKQGGDTPMAMLIRMQTDNFIDAFSREQRRAGDPATFVEYRLTLLRMNRDLLQQFPRTWEEYRVRFGPEFQQLPMTPPSDIDELAPAQRRGTDTSGSNVFSRSVENRVSTYNDSPSILSPTGLTTSFNTGSLNIGSFLQRGSFNPGSSFNVASFNTPTNNHNNDTHQQKERLSGGNYSNRKVKLTKGEIAAFAVPYDYTGGKRVYCHDYVPRARGWKLVSPYPNLVPGDRYIKYDGNDNFDQMEFLTIMFRNQDGRIHVEKRIPPEDWKEVAEVESVNKLTQQSLRRFLNNVGSRAERGRYDDEEIEFMAEYIKKTQHEYDWKKLAEHGEHVQGLIRGLITKFGTDKKRKLHGILNKLQRHPLLLEARGIEGDKLEKSKKDAQIKKERKAEREKERMEKKRKAVEAMERVEKEASEAYKKRKIGGNEETEEAEGDYLQEIYEAAWILTTMSAELTPEHDRESTPSWHATPGGTDLDTNGETEDEHMPEAEHDAHNEEA